jgi:hypothetical protein
MAARLGEVLFWACISLAGLWLYAVYGPGGGPKVDITGYAIAAHRMGAPLHPRRSSVVKVA